MLPASSRRNTSLREMHAKARIVVVGASTLESTRLLLNSGIANFYEWKCQQDGIFVSGGNACQKPGNPKLKLMKSTTPPPKVFKIERDQSLEQLN